MPKAIVLGGGMVGSVMAADLAADGDFEVTLADMRPAALEAASARARGTINTIQADLSELSTIKKIVQPFDIVLGALASTIGFQTLRAVIEAGKNYCDICFMPQDAWELDGLAKERGVSAIVDCGIAPGMSNMLAGYASAPEQLDSCEAIEIYVGGLPRERRWPFHYKAAFSPYDVIEEYTRPTRVVEHGRILIKEALSEPELVDFPGIGTLEAFNTDGLRSLAHFLKAPFMKEKTLRYPGHIELMRAFRATGLFSHEPILVPSVAPMPGQSEGVGRVTKSVMIRPIDLTSALMFPKWTYQPGEEDLTVMRVVVEGTKAGRRRRYLWDMLDFYDKATGATSMARTTAFPCTTMARMLARGEFPARGGGGPVGGVIPPELIGREPGMLDRVLAELGKRRIVFQARVE